MQNNHMHSAAAITGSYDHMHTTESLTGKDRLMDLFESLDVDTSGNIDLQEFGQSDKMMMKHRTSTPLPAPPPCLFSLSLNFALLCAGHSSFTLSSGNVCCLCSPLEYSLSGPVLFILPLHFDSRLVKICSVCVNLFGTNFTTLSALETSILLA